MKCSSFCRSNRFSTWSVWVRDFASVNVPCNVDTSSRSALISLGWVASIAGRLIRRGTSKKVHKKINNCENNFLVRSLIPRAQLCPAQIHSVSQHRERLRRQFELSHSRLYLFRPGKSSLFQPLDQQPKSGPVPIDNLDPGMPPIAEHKQCAATWIFAQSFAHRRVQPIKSLAHVARLQGHEHLKAAGK